ncbi:MAG: DUF4325 domain-containing protein [Gammaproteobacteria bacterium]|nr:DUF4325 domain-containing protein [Gammaproteobacteria bacterium]
MGNTFDFVYGLNEPVDEAYVWSKDILPTMTDVHQFSNILDIWEYGFTEMLNNAIDHSEGQEVMVRQVQTPSACEIQIHDDGVGIFKRIQQALQLTEEQHALLELSKGKITTAPEKHTGEGIFFTSRVFDNFAILSGGLYFSHQREQTENWVDKKKSMQGTSVFMTLSNHSSRTLQEVFDEFVTGEEHRFNKTVIPVSRVLCGNENPVSRSQAKRLLSGVDRFETVWFDFEGIDSIGRSFADEMFRVFRNEHPQIEIVAINTKPGITKLIEGKQP